MNKEKVFLMAFALLGVLVLSGCNSSYEGTPECESGDDCYKARCINYTCVPVECIDRYDCYYDDYASCIDYKCVSHIPKCVEIAKKDYGMANPKCEYFFSSEECYCKNYVIDSPRKEIEKENSIQIIEEQGHYEFPSMVFEIKE